MFCGIVEVVGLIKGVEHAQDCLHLIIQPLSNLNDLQVGDSIAVNGVCLTVTKLEENHFYVTAVPETLRLTNLSTISEGSLVNLERSLKANARIGGHYVQGHVDGVGQVLDLTSDGQEALIAKISLPQALTKYVVKKGYIALDGMSITVIDVTPEWFTVTFIPHTQQVTIVNRYQKETFINIEVDILGKYVERFLEGTHANSCQTC